MGEILWAHQNRNQLLNSQVLKNNFLQVFLILGPSSIGKYTLSKNIAKIFLCLKSQKSYCAKCQDCLMIEEERHPDLIIIRPKISKNPTLSIAEARRIKKLANLSSHFGGYKVFIIESADKMTIEAQNALLKTLEEPNPKTIFILTAVSEKLILATILSRCQKIKLSSLSIDQIKKYLKKQKINLDNIELIARYSMGRPGKVLKYIRDEKAVEEILNRFKEIAKILKSRDIFFRFEKAEEFSKSNQQSEIIDFFEIFFRDLLHLKISSEQFLVNISAKDELVKIVKDFSLEGLINIIKKIEYFKLALVKNVNPKLVFENLMLAI